MKRELNEQELDEVVGGTVTLSAPLGIVNFSALGASFKIKGDVKQMRNLLIQLYDENENMSDREFDTLVVKAYRARGWI